MGNFYFIVLFSFFGCIHLGYNIIPWDTDKLFLTVF